MHSFDELIYRSTVFNLKALEEANSTLREELQKSSSTIYIKNLQMIQLQKAIIAVGMFSLFESIIQEGLDCRNGFVEAKKILDKSGNIELANRFKDFINAINVLKHGKGRSYDMLVSTLGKLPFRIKLPGEYFFEEGDLAEVSTFIEVDDKFVLQCAEIIEQVTKEIRKFCSDYIM
jgi:hypothetical protein